MSTTAEKWKEKNEKSGRPISPHVLIYKFPIAAITSIVNRGTGLALSGGLEALFNISYNHNLYISLNCIVTGIFGIAGISLFYSSTEPQILLQTIGSLSILGPIAKFSVSFPLVYHYFAALRHFMWDFMPGTLLIPKVNQSSYILIASSVAVSGVLAFLQI
jgi:succinate dehydrogenase (ubiquinone) cytochrome b560 subunit